MTALGMGRGWLRQRARWGAVALLLLALCAAIAPGTALAADADTATVASLTPGSGPVAGGTQITITGTGLATVSEVLFDKTSAAPASASDTQVTVVSPPGSAGSVPVTLVFTDTSTFAAGSFTYFAPPPSVSAVSPNAGPLTGNAPVTISGTGFQTGATATFGGNAASSITVNSDISITATPPDSATAVAVDVTVTNPDTQSGTAPGAFTYVAAPTITGLDTTSGPVTGGTAVTINGTNLALTSAVTFGGAPATITSASDTQVAVTTPAHAAGAVDIIVVTPGGTVTSTGAFAYVAAPTITSISPNTGSTDDDELTQVTITGTGFQQGAMVTFGGIPATNVVLVDATKITATAPAHAAGAVNVVVKNPDGQSATGTFTYVQAGHGPPSQGTLSVRQVEPPAGSTAGGEHIVIKGTGFAAGATVTIGGNQATDVRVLNSTTISATTPAHAAGTVSVAVTVNGTTKSLDNAYTYRDTQGRGNGGPPEGRGDGNNGNNGHNGAPPAPPTGRHGQDGSQPTGGNPPTGGNVGPQPGAAPTHR